MSNPLTGDFDAVLQVGGGTVNRLMATLHQNAFGNSKLPSFPHSVRLRLGEPRAVDGVRGILEGQIGVPRIQLIHGVTDRFVLEVGVRALFKPETGSTPFPTYIDGTVRAEYRIRDINPSCFGWSAYTAGKYLWIYVVKESVRFTGTAEDDANPAIQMVSMGAAQTAADHAAKEAAITRQAVYLLAKRFAAAPHPVSPRFRRGSMRSLREPSGASAVAVPLGLNGDPVGDIGTIENLLPDNSDFAIGISVGSIKSLADPALQQLTQPIPAIPVPVHVPTGPFLPDIDFSTVYHVNINPPTFEWLPFGSHAVIRIAFSGSAKTASIAPDATFEVTADLVLQFDAGNERLFLTPGFVGVNPHVSGLASGLVEGRVKGEMQKLLASKLIFACQQAQPSLNAMIARKQELIEQLQTLDGQAGAWFDWVNFLQDGIVLHGTIPLTRRARPVTTYDKTLDKNAFTALQSWIPGGRVDHLEWTWNWFAGQYQPGAATHDDRFLLKRAGGKLSPWGMAVNLSLPLPGLDGGGSVCLKVKGVHVDEVTGELVRVESIRRCHRFGIDPSVKARPDRGRLFLQDLPKEARDVPFPQLTIRAVAGASRSTAANTLLVYSDRGWNPEIERTLHAGLEGTRRRDAGLLLLVLFPDGALSHGRPDFLRDIEEFGRHAGIHTVVSEDVRGGWNRAFALDAGSGEVAWRLLTPTGGVTWMGKGGLSPRELTEALNHHLRPSAQVQATPAQYAAAVGSRVGIAALYTDPYEDDGDCPPLPVGRISVVPMVVAFVQGKSAASAATLRSLAARYGPDRDDHTEVIVVADGMNRDETARMKNELGFDFITMPDSRGEITDRFGVRAWPTTIRIEPGGLISAVRIGSTMESADDPSESSADRGGDA